MSRRWMTVFALMAMAAAAPSYAQQGAERRLSSVEDRITALEDQLRESQAIIKSQQDELKARGPAAVGQGGSSLDKFLQTVEIGGHISASYSYNFVNPKTNNATNTFCQFQCNSNEFSFDAAKLEIGRTASEPGSLGFHLDLLYGQNASILRNLAPGPDREFNGTAGQHARVASDSDVFVEQAFASYNLNGVEFKLGKWETFLGYEVLDTEKNPNVTQGTLFTFAIPAYHTGLLLSGNMTENLSWAAGLVNGFNNTREFGHNKAMVGKLAWNQGPVLAQVSTYFGTLGESRPSPNFGGALVPDDGLKTKIFDGILQFSPTESFKVWLNADLGHTQKRSLRNDPNWFAVAVGAKQQLGEKLYVSLRGEYFLDDGGSRLGSLVPGFTLDQDDISLYTGTLTFGYQVTPNLLTRLEYRHDFADCKNSNCKPFFGRGQIAAGGKDTNDLAILELVYSFE